METLYFTIDASRFTTRREAHRVMKEVFAGYEYYGNNLDALHDVLTSIRQDAEITVCGLDAARQQIGAYADRLLRVFGDASEENSHLHFFYPEEATEEETAE